jgi:hypothetical protein
MPGNIYSSSPGRVERLVRESKLRKSGKASSFTIESPDTVLVNNNNNIINNNNINNNNIINNNISNNNNNHVVTESFEHGLCLKEYNNSGTSHDERFLEGAVAAVRALSNGYEREDAKPVRQRLLVVANRLPVSAVRKGEDTWSLEISAGGLVSALLGMFFIFLLYGLKFEYEFNCYWFRIFVALICETNLAHSLQLWLLQYKCFRGRVLSNSCGRNY